MVESAPRISFIVSLLDEAVKCGQKHSRYIPTDDPTKHGKLTGLGSSVGRESPPRISFIVSLLEEAVKCGQKHSRYILQMIPPNMVS